ncbi:hypothetical protein [Nocardia fluminea]|uniref:DUF8020 domain-containing protein n=1 Tax=Nocardia fluminea TaxID=134984 RepID=A0A2N3WXV7_9NOCA|nr:hypothetical protein [Nocardia fluminea]PKV98706.1 hypothetical protein ATK86_0728 [Nocardia fluminea]
MKLGFFPAATLLVGTAVWITAATAAAQPVAPPPPEATTSGVDQSVHYEATLTEFSRVLTTTVAGGTFTTTEDNTAVTLIADSGAVVTRIPLIYQISGKEMRVAQTISDNGHHLVLAPQPAATAVGEMQAISPMSQLTNEINRNVVGVIAGGILGGLIGTVLGFGFLSIITGPVGLVLGAIAGGYAMGGQPFLDAVTAAVSGQP